VKKDVERQKSASRGRARSGQKKRRHQLSMFSIKVGHSSKLGRASGFESLESRDIQRG
jgi:hypothetical protein